MSWFLFLYCSEAALYYDENRDLLQKARESGWFVDVCHSLNFKVTPNRLALDVGESANVEVTAFDVRPNIALNILSSDEKSNTVDVSIEDRKEKSDDGTNKEHLTHDWDVKVHAIRNYKQRIIALLDSFFGKFTLPLLSIVFCVMFQSVEFM